MDYSVEGYLKRSSSVRLEAFLFQCMYRRQWDSYSHIVPQIISLLQSRNHPIPQQILDSWERYTADDEPLSQLR